MNYFLAALHWLGDPARWSGAGSIPLRLAQHVGISALALLIAAVIAIPLGVLVGHTRRGTALTVALTGALRAIPILGLVTIFGLWLGIGIKAPLLALVVIAIPSLLAGTYAGFEAVDRDTVAASSAIGMSPAQVIWRVEFPLALPVIVGGIRTAALQIIATATIAAYVSDTGLGRFLFEGLKLRQYPEMLASALLVIALALLVDILLAALQRLAWRRADPAGAEAQQRRRRTTSPATESAEELVVRKADGGASTDTEAEHA